MVAKLRGTHPVLSLAFYLLIEISIIDAMQTNVKGTFLTIRAFIPTANKVGASFLAVTTGTAALPPVMLPELSGYISSKLAQIKVVEYLAAENHNLFATTIHSGLVETCLFKRSGSKAENLPMDKGWTPFLLYPIIQKVTSSSALQMQIPHSTFLLNSISYPSSSTTTSTFPGLDGESRGCLPKRPFSLGQLGC